MATVHTIAIPILYAVRLRLFTSNRVSGFTLPFVAMPLIGGLQFISLSVIGAYIGRIYNKSKQRLLYVVAERITGAPNARPQLRGRRAAAATTTTGVTEPATAGGGIWS